LRRTYSPATSVFVSPAAYNHREREQLTVGALSDLGSQQAGLVAGKEGSRVGVGGVAKGGLVVILGQGIADSTAAQDAVETALSASLLDGSLTTSVVASLDAAGLKLLGAVSQRSTLGSLEEFTALGRLLGDVMARMSRDEAGHES